MTECVGLAVTFGFPISQNLRQSHSPEPEVISNCSRRMAMPQFVIEREMPGVGKLGQNDLKAASQGSCSVIRSLGPEIQWVHSYVTDDKIYCVYRAPSADLIRKHAETAGFPANSIAQVRATIDPTTAE
jgi:hypothetical protein